MAKAKLIRPMAAIFGAALMALGSQQAAASTCTPLVDLEGTWHMAYQEGNSSAYCVMEVGAAGDFVDAECKRGRNGRVYVKASGNLLVDPACAVTGDITFAGRGNGKNSVERSVEAQLSEDATVMVGIIAGTRRFLNIVAIKK